jgi:glycosyltransferase involved in cell wall biosynthesis
MPGSIAYFARRGSPVLDHLARKCGTRPVFRVEGATSSEVHQVLEQADIFVLAAEWEGQSIAMNEAMSMECACVTWPSCGLLDIIENDVNGLMAPQNDVMALVDAVRHLQSEPEDARRLGKAGREWVKEHLSWSRFRENLARAWAKVETHGVARSAETAPE